MEEGTRIYLSSPFFEEESIWLDSENQFKDLCDSCNSIQNVWKVYSYADGYVQFCLDMVTKYVESRLLKPNLKGRIKSYEKSELLLKAASQKSISWRMKIYCETCSRKTEYRGASSWRSDSNHYFEGKCVDCQTCKSGGIKTLLMDE